MFPVRIGLASRVQGLELAELSKVAAAINLQVSRDFGPLWDLAASVTALEDADKVPPGIWPVYIQEKVDGGFLGVHFDEHNQPYATVQYGKTWSLTASHETLEMLADPSGNKLVWSSSVEIVDNELRDGDQKFQYLMEVCDPCEDAATAYLIDDVLVCDFYTPHYFDPVVAPGVRYGFSGAITRPRQVLPGGYLSWINPVTRTVQQAKAFGAPEIKDLGPVDPGTQALRAFVDRKTPPPVSLSNLPASTPILQRQARRHAFIAQSMAQEVTPALAPVLAAAPASADQTPEAVLAGGGAAQLGHPGVLSVRPGWLSDGAWIGDRRGIIVIAKPDQADAVRTAIGPSFQGVPVEVRSATPLQRLATGDRRRFAVMAEARHELRSPDFPDETHFDDQGHPVVPQPFEALLAASRASKPQLPYQPPAGAALDPVTGPIDLTLHISPDAGWAQLSAFLAAVEQRMVVGMYDFTSAHILDAVEQAMVAADRTLTLTLDHPAKNPTADQTDEQSEDDLSQLMGQRFEGAWALTRGDPKATKWSFPTAYHIKVAVADEDRVWLSSGNWNNSNQPVIDLTDLTAARKIASKSDRDWHVIAKSKALADIFRTYLEGDYTTAHANNAAATTAALAAMPGEEPLDATMLTVPADVFAAARPPQQFFQPKTVSGSMTVQPLLSPDNYQPQMLKLIERAQTKFYMQTQYIHTASTAAADAGHAALIAAVQARIAAGVDVRLITSEYETKDWLEKLKDTGFDISCIRVQPRVHNKGVIVDGAVAMVSSQNWSADGTLRNRDAGLIIENEEAAAYFEQIFLYDWNNLAAARTLD